MSELNELISFSGVASLVIDNLFSNAFIMFSFTTKTVIYQACGRTLNSKVTQFKTHTLLT